MVNGFKLKTLYHFTLNIAVQRLQYLLFPEGMRYDKENKRVRTPGVNSVVSLISSVARVSEENEKGYLVKSSLDSRFVVPTGIEPVSKV